jgi:hypothetical protein
MIKALFRNNVFLLSLFALSFFGSPGNASAEDELNCVLCHKHRGLSRIDENGNFRLFYINEALFEEGPHVRLMCLDCHRDIKRIPHDPTRKVDCTVECHLTEPSSRQRFSHKPMAEKLAASVHAKFDADGNPKEHQEDYPGCKDCHEEPLYRPLSFFKGKSHGVSPRGLSRCQSCHRTGKFAESFYKHVTSRLQKMRKPAEIVGICAKCHGDKGFQQRHKLDDVVTSYKETFHWKAIRFGSEETPDCMDCHVVKGESVHFIEGKKSLTSASHPNNIPTTCRTSECHGKAGPMLAQFQVHVTYDKEKYPMQYYLLKFFQLLMAGVMYFFLVLIFLELLRRLFPHFSFFKSPDDGRHASKRR